MNTTGRERVERRLTAILAAGAAGYSRGLMRADKEGTLAALRTLRREFADPKIQEHRGRIVKTTGDGLLVQFVSVVDAVRCAVEMQRGMAVRSAFATLTNPFTGEVPQPSRLRNYIDRLRGPVEDENCASCSALRALASRSITNRTHQEQSTQTPSTR